MQWLCLVIGVIALASLLLKKRPSLKFDFFTSAVFVYGILLSISYLRTNLTPLNTGAYVTQIFGIATFFLLIHLNRKENIETVFKVLLWATLIASVYGILQYFGLDPLAWEDNQGRYKVKSFFGHKNLFSSYLLLMIPVTGYLALTRESPFEKWFCGACWAASISALALSNSRGAFLAFAFICIAFLILYWLYISGGQKRAGVLTPVLFTVSALVLATILMPNEIKSDYSRLFPQGGSLEERRFFFEIALETIGRHPFFGVGPGNYLIAHQLNDVHKFTLSAPTLLLDHVHNELLEIWVEDGILALVLFLFILGSCLTGLHARIKENLPTQEKYLGICLMLSLTGCFIYSLVDVGTRYISTTLYFWMLLGCSYLFLGGYFPTKSITLEKAYPALKIGVLLTAIVAGFWLARNVLEEFLSDHYLRKASTVEQTDVRKSLSYLENSIRTNPKYTQALYQSGYLKLKTGRAEEALAEFEMVQRLSPNFLDVAQNQAACFYKMQDWKRAISMAEWSLRLYPNHEKSIALLAYSNFNIKNFESSLLYANRALEQNNANERIKALVEKIKAIKGNG